MNTEMKKAVAKATAEGKEVFFQGSSACYPQVCDAPEYFRDGFASFNEAGRAVDVPCRCGSQDISTEIQAYYLEDGGKKVILSTQYVVSAAGQKNF